jgi:hypothetical protein
MFQTGLDSLIRFNYMQLVLLVVLLSVLLAVIIGERGVRDVPG